MIYFPDDEEADYMEFHQWGEPDTVWKRIHGLAHDYQINGFSVTLVIEQFDKRPGVANPDFTPKFICRDITNNIFDVPIVWQIPAVAKNMVKPPRKGGTDGLRRFGWYKTANGHANDAARHVLVHAVRTLKHMPTILKGWPKPKEFDV